MKQLMNAADQQEWKAFLLNTKPIDKYVRKVGITITSPEGEGAVWLGIKSFTEALREQDKEAEGVLFYSAIGRNHVHGVVYTTLSNTKLKQCISGAWVTPKTIYDEKRWVDYILKQASDEPEITI